MTAQDFLEKCHHLTIYQKRDVDPDYAEVVFLTKDLSEWTAVFTDVFGEPLSPAGTPPTPEITQLTKDYGGISAAQTLYKKDFSGKIVLAMLWPWQDNAHTTLKIICL